ncbi:hypothetical protein HPB50_003025 [Hyalomma asiaticum]|uniref:Uncharacterized protein n=1 Tax=Hyalomma asiaticum TaxID=266040 RepID=A0ACB7RXK9_HYAAI|nr:hypothetical protein HPB50_003025 [Hyalomma asiaticum]
MQDTCLPQLVKNPFLTYLTDWIILPGENSTLAKGPFWFTLRTEASGKPVAASMPIQADKIGLSLSGAIPSVLKYGEYDSGQRTALPTELAGSRVVLACFPTVNDRATKTSSCLIQPFTDVFATLHTLNVTLVPKMYSSYAEGTRAIIEGSADIFVGLARLEDRSVRFFLYPHPLKYTRETFYVYRDSMAVKTSVLDLIGGSPMGLIFLVAITLIVWIVLVAFDYFDYGGLQRDALMDSGMFLVATFLANSAPVDTGSSRRGAQLFRIGRATALTAWLLGILPLSSYFRSELTSRLTITTPPDYVDTVEELTRALDRNAMKPCLLKDGCMHSVVEGEILNGEHSLEGKLKKAFDQNMGRGIFDFTNECLQCASRPGYVCLLCGQRECDLNVKRNFVESRDSLKLTLATMPVRKSFVLAESYEKLLQRMFETAMPPFYKQIPCEANLLGDERDNENGMRLSQIFELSDFLFLYLYLLLGSFITLCLELTLNRWHIVPVRRTDTFLDSAMFLVASFLANSAPVNTSFQRVDRRLRRLGRTMLLTAWILGILPLSSYFRSELTSRLTVTRPKDHVDTVEELYMALDRKEMQPCVVRDGCFHDIVEGRNLGKTESLEGKLREAFQQNQPESRHVYEHFSECLECANRSGYSCLLCGPIDCDVDIKRNFVVSRDSLRPTLATTPVRKSYHLGSAYDQLLRRLFETGLPPFYKEAAEGPAINSGYYQLSHGSRPCQPGDPALIFGLRDEGASPERVCSNYLSWFGKTLET